MKETMKKTIAQIQADKERLEQITTLQDYINDNILSALDAQKIATLICQQSTLVTLVKEMRKAQKAYENAPKKTHEDIDAIETYVFEMLEAEKKLDTFLKYMEDIK